MRGSENVPPVQFWNHQVWDQDMVCVCSHRIDMGTGQGENQGLGPGWMADHVVSWGLGPRLMVLVAGTVQGRSPRGALGPRLTPQAHMDLRTAQRKTCSATPTRLHA